MIKSFYGTEAKTQTQQHKYRKERDSSFWTVSFLLVQNMIVSFFLSKIIHISFIQITGGLLDLLTIEGDDNLWQ